MATIKLFQTQPYLRETKAKIVAVENDCLVLDHSLFAPEAGGQSCDLGTIAGLPVLHVEERDGTVYHKLKEIPAALQPGKEVPILLDWPRRFDHMQNHCGEHILSGILFTKFGVANKGFHLGAECSTLDADIKQSPSEMIAELETLANQAVFAKLPVLTEVIEDQEEAENLPLRKPLQVQEDISIVTIPGVDCVACCCPQLETTAEVGLIKILRTENYKGMTRIFFKCGNRALADYQKKHDVITLLNQKYSATEDTLIEKIKIQDQKLNQIKRELHHMKDLFAKIEAEKLLSLAEGQSLVLGNYQNESLDDLKLIAKNVMEKTKLPVVLATNATLSVFLSHSGESKLKCGQIVKDYACGFGGKGGGNDTFAQALFTHQDVMENFIKIVQAQLRNE